MGKGRINYRRIKESELSVSLFADFDRYQEVNAVGGRKTVNGY